MVQHTCQVFQNSMSEMGQSEEDGAQTKNKAAAVCGAALARGDARAQSEYLSLLIILERI